MRWDRLTDGLLDRRGLDALYRGEYRRFVRQVYQGVRLRAAFQPPVRQQLARHALPPDATVASRELRSG